MSICRNNVIWMRNPKPLNVVSRFKSTPKINLHPSVIDEKLTNMKTCVSFLILWHSAVRFEITMTFSHHHHCSCCCSVNSLHVDEHYCNLSRLSLNCFSISSDAHRRKCQLHHIDYCEKSMEKLIIIFTFLK